MPAGRLGAAVTAALIGLLGTPSGAAAATVTFESLGSPGMTAVFVRDGSAVPAETNDITVGWDGATQEIVIGDTGAALAVGPGGCTAVSAAEVRCPKPTDAFEVRPGPGDDKVTFLPGLPVIKSAVLRPWVVDDQSGALTGSGDDRYTGAGEPNNLLGSDGADIIDGGGGNDQLITRSTDAQVFGGAGDDVLQSAFPSTADSGTTLLDGGAGDDAITGLGRLIGGPGDDGLSPTLGPADVIDGGPGEDAVSYAFHGPDPVTIDLAGGASFPQGMPGEADSITNVENVRTSQFTADVVYGTDGPNRLEGLAGADELHGRAGDDIIEGGSLFTGTHFGSDGPDVIDGGPGADAAAYAGRNVGVIVDLRRDGDQGEPGENDLFQSIEGAWDGAGGDLLIGSAGIDSFRVTGGTDRVQVRDGVADSVVCATHSGPEDIVVADAVDEIAGGCTAERPPSPSIAVDSDGDGIADATDPCPGAAGPGGCPAKTVAPPPALPQLASQPPALAAPRAASLRLRADRRRRVAVRLGAAPATESVTVTLRRRGRTLASTKVKTAKGRASTARLRLSAGFYAELRRKRKLSARLTLTAGARSRTQTVTLRQ